MSHNLKIEIEDAWEHPSYIRVNDWSEYDRVLPASNRVLKVEIPGIEGFSIVPFPQGSGYVYTAKSFKIATEVCPLNDGLWTFTYSVAPNEKVFTKVYHFRTVVLEEQLDALLACMLTSDLTSEDKAANDRSLIECLLMLKSLHSSNISPLNSGVAYSMYGRISRGINNLQNAIR